LAAEDVSAAEVFEAESVFDDAVESVLLFDDVSGDDVVESDAASLLEEDLDAESLLDEALDEESLLEESWVLASDFLELELLSADFVDIELVADFWESELEPLPELLLDDDFAPDESEEELAAFCALSDELAAGATAAYAGAPSTTIASTNPQKIATRVSVRLVAGRRRARSVVSMPVTSRRAPASG
jgi:hypothetical protein